jgi:hypothetical protein
LRRDDWTRRFVPSERVHTITPLASALGPDETCGWNASCPAGDSVDTAPKVPPEPADRTAACTRVLVPSNRIQVTIALPVESIDTCGWFASPPDAETVTGVPKLPPAGR